MECACPAVFTADAAQRKDHVEGVDLHLIGRDTPKWLPTIEVGAQSSAASRP
jgi:hypothetical protein